MRVINVLCTMVIIISQLTSFGFVAIIRYNQNLVVVWQTLRSGELITTKNKPYSLRSIAPGLAGLFNVCCDQISQTICPIKELPVPIRRQQHFGPRRKMLCLFRQSAKLAYFFLWRFFLRRFLRLWVAILWPFLFFPLGIVIII